MNNRSILFLSRLQLNEIYHYSINCLPFESCGFILGMTGYCKTIFSLQETKNQETEINRFTIDPFEFYLLEKSLEHSYKSIIGFFHSHPNGTAHPSRIDYQLAWPGYSYLIIALDSTKTFQIKCWVKDENTEEYYEEELVIV